MGEANLKKKRRAAYFKEHRYCCFCGGKKTADTIDHVPSRQTFILKRRPKGLEVPACYNCNQKTKNAEQVAALMARLYPDPQNNLEKEELRKLFKAVNNNNSGLLQELQPSWQQRYDFEKSNLYPPGLGGPLNAKGPLLNEAMQLFGVKLCLALHYKKTGKIVPEEGGCMIRWFSNYERDTNQIPQNLLSLFSEHETLRQGTWNVEEQFGYSWAIAENGSPAAYFAGFRQSFAVAGFVYDDRDKIPKIEGMKIWIPGFICLN